VAVITLSRALRHRFFDDFGSGIDQNLGTTVGYFSKLFLHLDHSEITLRHPDASFDNHAPSVSAMHRFHNLIVLEKGDNSFPSNLNFESIDVERLDDIVSALTMTRGGRNHNRLGVLYDVFMAAGRLDRAATVLQSIRRLPPLPSSYFERPMRLAKARGDSGYLKQLELEFAEFEHSRQGRLR
jgi:hypothetical protein